MRSTRWFHHCATTAKQVAQSKHCCLLGCLLDLLACCSSATKSRAFLSGAGFLSPNPSTHMSTSANQRSEATNSETQPSSNRTRCDLGPSVFGSRSPRTGTQTIQPSKLAGASSAPTTTPPPWSAGGAYGVQRRGLTSRPSPLLRLAIRNHANLGCHVPSRPHPLSIPEF